MSAKKVVFFGIVAFCAWSLQKHTPPPPQNASQEDSVAVMQAGLGARYHYGVGLVGVKIMGSTVNDMIAETEDDLQGMSKDLKKAWGPDGVRARSWAKRILEMNADAREQLRLAHPIKAARTAMQARNLLGAVRGQLNRG